MQKKIRYHGESKPGPEECYSSHLTSSARGPFATFPHDHIPFTSDLLTSDPAGGSHGSSSSPPPLSFHASKPSFKLSKLVKACWAVALIHPSSSTAPTIHRPSLQITDPRPTLAGVNGQRRLPNPRQRTYLPTASPPTPSSWIFPED